MRRLYNDNEALNTHGKKYEERIKAALRPIVKDAAVENFRLWELANLISVAMNMEIAFAVTQRRYSKRSKVKNVQGQ